MMVVRGIVRAFVITAAIVALQLQIVKVETALELARWGR